MNASSSVPPPPPPPPRPSRGTTGPSTAAGSRRRASTCPTGAGDGSCSRTRSWVGSRTCRRRIDRGRSPEGSSTSPRLSARAPRRSETRAGRTASSSSAASRLRRLDASFCAPTANGSATDGRLSWRRCATTGGGSGGGDSAPSGASPHPTHSAPSSRLASQLDQGYQSSVAYAVSSAASRDRHAARPFDNGAINVSVTDYAVAGAGGQNTSLASDAYLQRGGASIPPEGNGAWDTYYTNEGVAYYVNSQTGVTQWEKPNP